MVKQRILSGRIEPMTGVILLHTALGHVPRGPPGAFPNGTDRWKNTTQRISPARGQEVYDHASLLLCNTSQEA
jgi:hypothetical protein